MTAAARWTRRATFWLCSFASIAALLTHMARGPRMDAWARWGFGPCAVAMAACWLWARRDGDRDFLLRVRVGLIGGLLGTIGYDVFRIPFHGLGMNLLVPIRAYGVWLAGAGSSTYATDAAGFGYHVSNGVTFAWIYSLIMLRRHWVWAVVWGLGLEALAIVSPFGSVFGLQAWSPTLLIAFLGHVCWGVPVGWLCRRPERLDTALWPGLRPWLAGTLGTVAVAAWFLAARPAGTERPPPGTVDLGPSHVRPTWTDLAAGTELRLRNRTDGPLELQLRLPGPDGHRIESRSIEPAAALAVPLHDPGIYQVQVVSPSWRSVFVSVHADRSYR